MEVLFVGFGYLFFHLSSANGTNGRNKFDKWISDVTGVPINTSLRFSVSNFTIHIHHWCYLTILAIFVKNTIFRCFCIGGIVQGIVNYDDWHVLVIFNS
jgi:hypothetical protein